MRRYFVCFNLFLTGLVIVGTAYGLPAPSTLSQRERRDATPRATPSPRVQTRTAAVSERDRPSTTVVIDAGHGGHDRGGIAGQRVDEKTMNLDVAQRLKAVLQS